MKHIYIIRWDQVEYESSDILSIHASREGAIKFIEESIKNKSYPFGENNWVKPQEFSDCWNYSDQKIDIYKCELNP